MAEKVQNRENGDDGAVVLFDGICNLCNGIVRFIIKHDPEAYFKFASLQSDFSKKYAPAVNKKGNKWRSLILVEKGNLYYRSTAALKITRHLSGGWKFLTLFIIIPRFVRDGVYNLIAQKRYKWFGKRKECMAPDPGLKKRFL